MKSFVILLAAIASLIFPGNRAGAEAPANLSDWGLHCWCLTARHTPQRIIRSDTNGRILALAVHGITRAELDRQLPGVTESQLVLLQTYGLLAKAGESYTTAFPVFGPETVGPIRTRLAALAARTAPNLRSDVEVIVRSAIAQGHPASAYAMVFGYALDGTLWDELQRRGPLPDTALDLDHPFWRGAFWAIYPERTGAPGRNDVQLGSKRVLIGVWNDPSVARLNAKLELLQKNGSTAIEGLPVVVDQPGGAVHDAGQRIARTLATALLDSGDGRALLAQFPEFLRQQTILALAHEFIWSVTDELVRDGTINVPVAHAAARASDADVDALMFVMDSNPPN